MRDGRCWLCVAVTIISTVSPTSNILGGHQGQKSDRSHDDQLTKDVLLLCSSLLSLLSSSFPICHIVHTGGPALPSDLQITTHRSLDPVSDALTTRRTKSLVCIYRIATSGC